MGTKENLMVVLILFYIVFSTIFVSSFSALFEKKNENHSFVFYLKILNLLILKSSPDYFINYFHLEQIHVLII